jgi:hypothetical protein
MTAEEAYSTLVDYLKDPKADRSIEKITELIGWEFTNQFNGLLTLPATCFGKAATTRTTNAKSTSEN